MYKKLTASKEAEGTAIERKPKHATNGAPMA